MWKITAGQLTAAHKKLIKEAAASFYTDLMAGIYTPKDFRHTGFGGMNRMQIVCYLTRVVKALCDDNVPAPQLYYWNESIVYWLHEYMPVIAMADGEEDESKRCKWCQLIADALGEFDITPPDMGNMATALASYIGPLSRVILKSDRHIYKVANHIMDLPPEEAREEKRRRNIPFNYYVETPDFPTKAEYDRARKYLENINAC